MSRPRFLADEDLRFKIVMAVRQLEPLVEIMTVQEAELQGSSDSEVLEFAATQKWLVVSHDVNTMCDEAERRVAQGMPMHGLFLVPQSRLTADVSESLHLVWSASSMEEWHNRIVYLPL